MYINWTKDVYIDPVTLTAGAGPNGIPIPTYGNYGGPDYSDGSVGGIIPTSGGIPTNEALIPVDKLDALFAVHDLAYQNSGAAELPSADLALIHGIEYLTATHQLDAEGSFYGGTAILGVAAFMAVDGHPLSPGELFLADATALYDIQHGLSHLSSAERAMATAELQNIVDAFGHSIVQLVGTTTLPTTFHL
jgi:hypothetical protein